MQLSSSPLHSAPGHPSPSPHTSLPPQPGSAKGLWYLHSRVVLFQLLPNGAVAAWDPQTRTGEGEGRVETSPLRISWDSAHGPGGLHLAGEGPVPPRHSCIYVPGEPSSSFPAGDRDLWVSPPFQGHTELKYLGTPRPALGSALPALNCIAPNVSMALPTACTCPWGCGGSLGLVTKARAGCSWTCFDVPMDGTLLWCCTCADMSTNTELHDSGDSGGLLGDIGATWESGGCSCPWWGLE